MTTISSLFLNDSRDLLSFGNTSTSNAVQSFVLKRNLSERIVGAFVLCIIIFTTVVGNIMVVWAIFTYRPLKKVQNFFLVSLAVADLAVATLVMPLHVMKFLRDDWPLGRVVCILWITCDILLCTSSILNLCAIAIDRYFAIHDPLHYANKRTKKLVLTVCGVVWLVSGLISIPPLMGWNDWEKTDMSSCTYTTDRGFVSYSALGSFYIPLVIMTVIYCKIFFAARQRIQKHTTLRRGICVVAGGLTDTKGKSVKHKSSPSGGRKDKSDKCLLPRKTTAPEAQSCEKIALSPMHSAPLKKPSTLGISGPDEDQLLIENTSAGSPEPVKKNSSVVQGFRDFTKSIKRRSLRVSHSDACEPPETDIQAHFKEREKISLSKEKRAAKTLAIIMGVFVLCWLPFFIFYVLDSFRPGSIHPKIYEAANWLGYINSSLNPIIYTIFNMDFRKGFKKIIFRHRGY